MHPQKKYVIASQSADWRGNLVDFRKTFDGRNRRYPRNHAWFTTSYCSASPYGIATPVCALVRDDVVIWWSGAPIEQSDKLKYINFFAKFL